MKGIKMPPGNMDYIARARNTTVWDLHNAHENYEGRRLDAAHQITRLVDMHRDGIISPEELNAGTLHFQSLGQLAGHAASWVLEGIKGMISKLTNSLDVYRSSFRSSNQ